ncbi:peptidoglycan-binding domain-containing protein [Oceanitalea stevensii]|uniref:Peptidoglycan-binding protein n=1 Tax=Oceanitalea stevensii TaxID=2763072 RepID=A0ABR8YYI6_9MICO|nr:peptidoglycan-binding domain-containing protein [Oceanitalea stevensii]MBD8061133.1 peptidoglycan-binding protein [Oceanitalea stevensii]
MVPHRAPSRARDDGAALARVDGSGAVRRPRAVRPARPAVLRASADRTTVSRLQRLVGNHAVAGWIDVPSTAQRVSAATGEGGQEWLRPGDTGPRVAELKTRLNAAGVAGTPLPVTETYDPGTVAVVRRLQRDSGVGVDGVVGPQTWEALDRLTATTSETVTTGPDHHAGVDAPTTPEITAIEAALNPTSSGPGGAARDWDGRADPVKRAELRTELHAALQEHLDEATPHVTAREAAKRAGRVLTTTDQEGAGRAAKSSVDAVFGSLASAATLTTAQETARSAFRFTAGVNLLDASDPAVRPPDPRDLSEWMSETDSDARSVQQAHGFNPRRTTQGEPQFFDTLLTEFIAQGSNRDDLERYDLFGFAFALQGPRVLSQTAVVAQPGFADTPGSGGAPSEAERLMRWSTWQTLVHEYIHTLAHPSFNAASGGNRILTEGFCETFTKDVLLHGGAIARAEADADPALRREVEGGDFPGFDPRFVPDYSSGEYSDYVAQAGKIAAEVGMAALRAAFFLGHVEAIGLKPDGSMIDPSAPDAAVHLMPRTVTVHRSVTSVTGLSIVTGAPEDDIVAANSGLVRGGPLPAAAYTSGLVVPGTSHHRTLAVADRSGGVAVETKAKIAVQHGVSDAALERANHELYHREPREGEWVLIPVH